MKKTATAMAALGGFLMAANPAAAQQAQCGPYEAIKEQLGKTHGEAPVFTGLSQNRTVTQVFNNPETGSYTVVIIRPDPRGLIGCLADAGEAGGVTEYVDPRALEISQ